MRGSVGLTAAPSSACGCETEHRSCRSAGCGKIRTWRCTRGAGSAARRADVSTPDTTKIDVQEHGANGQASERRLFMQLSAFGGCLDVKPLLQALESSRVEAVLYQDLNDARGVGVVVMSEDPVFFVTAWREVLNTDPFAGLTPKPELAMFGGRYASG